MAAISSGPPMGGARKGGVSRLGMMQAKLQEQLMVEKESRLLEMAARQAAERDNTIQRVTKSSASSLSSSLSSLSLGSSLSGQGRVRKLFEDRRSTGYDKSYPLNPVKSNKPGGGSHKPPVRGVVKNGPRGMTSDRGGGGYSGGYGQQRSRSQVPPSQRPAQPTRQPPSNLNTARRQSNGSTGRIAHHKSNPSLLDSPNNNNNNNNNTNNRYGRRPSNSNTSTPNSTPSPHNGSQWENEAPPARTPTHKKPAPKSKPSPAPSPRAQPGRKAPPKAATSRSSLAAPSPMVRRGSSPGPPKPRVVPAGMAQCSVCERCFNSDRIEKHNAICAKSKAKSKKRKVFDPIKMRNKGTDAEKYVARGVHLKEVKGPKKKDWRKQHQDFIATVRAAKGIKGYEAPPMDVSDYIQCPHCGRKFAQMAAERHIPKCNDIKSNKPAAGRKR